MGVGINLHEAGVGIDGIEVLEVGRLVDALESFGSGAVRLALLEIGELAGFLEVLEDGLESLGALGMTVVHAVVFVGRVTEERDGHGR